MCNIHDISWITLFTCGILEDVFTISNYNLWSTLYTLFEDIAKSIYCAILAYCNDIFLRIPLKYLIRNDERNTQGGFNDCEMQWCCINYITWEWNQYPGVIYILPFNFFNEQWFLVNDLYFLEKKVPLCGWDYYQLLLNKVWCQSILDFSFYLPLLQV